MISNLFLKIFILVLYNIANNVIFQKHKKKYNMTILLKYNYITNINIYF